MSGTYSSIKKAATNIKNQAKDFKLEVIDSKTNSGAQGLFVLEAAEQLEKGKNFVV